MNANGMELWMVAAFWSLIMFGPALYLGYKEIRRHTQDADTSKKRKERKARKRTS